MIDIGSNDFIPNGTAFNNLYNGTWTSTQTANYVNQVISNISTAISTEQAAGAKVVVSTIGNYAEVPAVDAVFTNAAGLQRVSSAIAQVERRNSARRANHSYRGG